MSKKTFIKKEIDSLTSFLYDRKEVVTAPMWPNNSSEIYNIFTSSNQPHHQRIYYTNVFSDNTRTGSLDVDFSIAYGHYAGSGSSTGSYGLISSSTTPVFPVSESMAIYSQYRSMLYESDKRKYLSDGKFRFYGLTDAYLGTYLLGNDALLDHNNRINLPGVKSFQLNKVKSLSTYRYDDVDPKLSMNPYLKYYLINEEGKLFYNESGENNLVQIGTDEDWESVSFGFNHKLAIKKDGTIWGWGSNYFGELGLGYRGSGFLEPIKIGIQNNWKQVYAGNSYSFAINNDGELFAWGRNFDQDNGAGILGFGDALDRYSPQRLGFNTWKKISISNLEANTQDSSQTMIHGIDTEGKLWGWGNNPLVSFATEPTQLGTDTDWKDISAGFDFAIGIKGDTGELYGWGSAGTYGELLAGWTRIPTISATFLPFSSKRNLTIGNTYGIPEIGWSSLSCGHNFTFAINNNGNMYCWGDNLYGQLNMTSIDGYERVITLSSELFGWNIVSCGLFHSTAAINTPDTNVNSIVSDDIYVINLNRWNFRDKVDAGNWQLSLRTVYTGSGQQMLYRLSEFTEPPYRNITLIDDSVNLQGSSNENPMYDAVSKGGAVYGVYRGNLETGIDQSAIDSPYGLFFPENGIIILNGEMLLNSDFQKPSIQIQTRRTPATSSGAFPYRSNADLLYYSIKGAMLEDELPFIANTVETKMPTYCFIRINNDEFNHTMNRTKYQKDDSFLLKDKFRTVPYDFTYITTIGLYNDNDELLAVAKLSRPVLKNPSTELVIKIKLDI